MLKLTNNYATSSERLATVKLTNGVLTFWRGGDVPVTEPFALDFATLTDGWVKLTKGQPPEYMLQAAETEWSEDERKAMIGDGWQYLVCAKIKSREFPGVGLAELQIKSKPTVDAFNGLFQTFIKHGPEGGVPMVSHTMNALGDQEFTIHGFISRPALFGQPINILPALTGKSAPVAPVAPPVAAPTPAPKPIAPVDPKQAAILARLKARQSEPTI